jgi:hypothetical protein
MTEEIQEIERLIKQSGELTGSLIRLAQKLREQHTDDPSVQPYRAQYFRPLSALKRLDRDLPSSR